MKNLIKIKYASIVLALLLIPFFEEANAQLIHIPKDEMIDAPMPGVNTNQPVEFLINKRKLTTGEKIEVKAIFQNQTQQPLAGRMIVSIFPADKSFPAKPFIKEFNLLAGEKTADFVSEIDIEDWMPVGIYQAEVEIRDKNDYIIYKKSDFFEVFREEKNNNKIKAIVQVCADQDCFQQRAVFNKKETVYFKLDLAIQDVQINATIKTPVGKIEHLIFEDNFAEFKSDEVGKFSLWVNISKEGYEKSRVEREYMTEENYTEVEFPLICKIDGKCAGDENEENCSQDCSAKIIKIDSNFLNIIFGILTVIIIGLGVMVLRRRKKKNILE